MMTLEGIVIVIGLGMFSVGALFTYRAYNGNKSGFELLPTDDPGFETKKSTRLPITPDITYSDEAQKPTTRV